MGIYLILDQQNEAGAIPTMTESTGAPQNPYEGEYEKSKSDRLKELQKNRFQAAMPGVEGINDGMRNMNIVDNSSQPVDMAQIPQDMHIGGGQMNSQADGNFVPSSYGSDPNNDISM